MQEYSLGDAYLESRFTEKNLGVNMLIMSQQSSHTAKKNKNIMSYVRQSVVSQLSELILSLLSTGENTSAVLCPGLGSPAQERHGHTGVNPVKGPKG